ncbi:hypothetical protein [Streptomyces sp. NPDC002758]
MPEAEVGAHEPHLFCAAVFAALSVIGPWVVGVLGGLVTGLARRPATLLAGRRLLDDPKSAWRAVSSLTLAAFVAGFFALFSLGGGAMPWGAADQLALSVPKDRVAAVRQQTSARLERAGIEATVGTGDDWVATGTGERGERQVTAAVANPDRLDAARGALTGLVPGQHAVTGTDADWQSRQFDRDFHLVTLAVLGASFAIAIAATGITAASSGSQPPPPSSTSPTGTLRRFGEGRSRQHWILGACASSSTRKS